MVSIAVLSLVLIFVDHRYTVLGHVRYGLNYLVAPIQYVADAPARLVIWVLKSSRTQDTLSEENEQLRTQNLLLQRRVQKLATLAAENIRLRELLNSSALVDDKVLIAEIIGIDPDPFRHEVVLDKGQRDGVYVGQPLLDAKGLMGQVIEVGALTSRALLITDSSHAIPVHVNRNGVRAIAIGTGELDRLQLMHVPNSADIQVGDLLVSSGLGDRFPVGYPVGEVTRVEHDSGQPFAQVDVVPKSKLDRTRHVLLVFKETARAETKAADSAQAIQKKEPK
jgi:rod shape-determining protein MreC